MDLYKKQLSFDYDIIYRELIKIKNNIRNKKIDKNYKEWEERYWNDEVIDIMKLLSKKEIKIIKT